MNVPTEIAYRYEIVQLPKGPGSDEEFAELVDDIRMSSTGGYQYTHHETATPEVFVGSAPAAFFERMNAALPAGLFDPTVQRICAEKLIDGETRDIDRLSLRRFYKDGSKTETMVIIWDLRRHGREIPQHLLIMHSDIDKCLDGIRALALQKPQDAFEMAHLQEIV